MIYFIKKIVKSHFLQKNNLKMSKSYLEMAVPFVVLDLEPLEDFEVFEISFEESDDFAGVFSLDFFSTDGFDDGSFIDDFFLL